jgi:tetratricopeptide (TPR) repeat protein
VAGQKTEGRQERIDEALAILERAIERDSLDAHALAWYGEGAVLGGRYTPRALQALEQASRSLRGDPQLAKALDLARKSNALASRGVPTGQAAVDSLNARAESGRYEEALQLLDDMEGATTDEAVKKSIRENREQVERMRDHNRAVDAYNRGLAALQKEDFVSAARAFDAAREGARDSTLRANAVERLDEIPSYEAFQGGLAAAKKGNWTAALSAFEHARKLAKSDELRHMCDQNIAHIRAMNAKRVPAH